MEGGGGGGGGGGPPAEPVNPLEAMLQIGLQAAFGNLQQPPPQPGGGPRQPMPFAPAMPQIFIHMGGQQRQWEAFVHEAMDAQGGGADRPHPACKQAVRDMRNGDAHAPAAPALHVRHGGHCCCSPAAGADELDEACSVCQDDFAEGDRWIQMPCKHFFHRDCLTPWLVEHNTCPTCRAEVEEEPQAPPAAPTPAAELQFFHGGTPGEQRWDAADGAADDPAVEQLIPDGDPQGMMGGAGGLGGLFGQGMFPPGMFQPGMQQQRAGVAGGVHDPLQGFLQQLQQQQQQQAAVQQQQAQQQWEQWVSRLDQAAAAGVAAGPSYPPAVGAPGGIDLRTLFGGLRNENMVHHMQEQQEEEERQLQAAITASMAEEDDRATVVQQDGLTDADLAGLGVRELKAFLDAREVDYSHCVEKSELLAEARRALRERGYELEAVEAEAERETADLEEAIRLSLEEAGA